MMYLVLIEVKIVGRMSMDIVMSVGGLRFNLLKFLSWFIDWRFIIDSITFLCRISHIFILQTSSYSHISVIHDWFYYMFCFSDSRVISDNTFAYSHLVIHRSSLISHCYTNNYEMKQIMNGSPQLLLIQSLGI